MTDPTKAPSIIRMVIDIPVEIHADIATECYCCGNTSNEAISCMASLVLHHAWQDLGKGGVRPYWLSAVFEEIEDL
tara:strand:+ start:16554 stop:16781 length:228 start_codon:yes stop_codon:yes gene_type:complete